MSKGFLPRGTHPLRCGHTHQFHIASAKNILSLKKKIVSLHLNTIVMICMCKPIEQTTNKLKQPTLPAFTLSRSFSIVEILAIK